MQSGREESIKAAIERKVKIEGLEQFFGQIAIPVEESSSRRSVKVKDKKTGEKVTQEKKVIKKKKKFPATSSPRSSSTTASCTCSARPAASATSSARGLEARQPTPMTDREVQADAHRRRRQGRQEGPKGPMKVKLDFEKGDKVRSATGRSPTWRARSRRSPSRRTPTETPKVTVVVTICGRPVDVELDYWQVDKV